jgi:hypothetical protein
MAINNPEWNMFYSGFETHKNLMPKKAAIIFREVLCLLIGDAPGVQLTGSTRLGEAVR